MKILGFEIKRESNQTAAATTTQVSGANWMDGLLNGSSEAQAMKIAAVYRCVNLRSDSVAVMPLLLKHRNSERDTFSTYSRNDPEHWYYLLNVRPNSRLNGYTLKKNLVMQLDLKGNSFLMCKDENGKICAPNSGKVKSLYLLQSIPAYDKQRNKYTITDPINAISGTYSADFVIHLKSAGSDGGYWGESIISQARKTMSVAASAEEQALKTVVTGGLGKFILGYNQTDKGFGTHSQKQLKGAAEDVAESIRDNAVTVMPDPTLKLERLNLSAVDMQFLQSREFSIKDIARWFGVPVYKLGESTSNYKSVDASQVDFYVEALQPICSQIETELLAKVTTIDDYDKYKFDFDEAPLFALDRASQSAWMKSQMELGLKSVNDLRHDMDIAPVPDGETILMSANLKSISALKSEAQPANVEPQTQQ